MGMADWSQVEPGRADVMTGGLPSRARAVVIGGGIVGCSVAYHLTRLGWRDVVLLERGALSCGTTWHAAGLVGQLRSSLNMTRLIRYSTELYASLEAETGQATGWKRCGSLSVARTKARMTQLKRTASLARAFGVEAEVISPAEAGRRWPLMLTDDLVGAVWLPGDGKANPADITTALARGARAGGARIVENVKVAGIAVEDGAVAGVTTRSGDIACEVVVNCAGLWAREVGRLAGVTVPLHAVEHMYIVTRPIDGVRPDLPVMRDPDGHVYFKEEVGGLVMGGFEPVAKPWLTRDIPEDFAFTLLKEDWEQFEILMTNALMRVPALETAEIHQLVNGPESFTPDNHFILGEAPEVRRFFVAAGFNSAGIASAGGAGRALAEWIVEGRPTMDLWPVDIRRFARWQRNERWLRERAVEVPGLHYAVAFPLRDFKSGRGVRRSPLHERLAAKGAVFGSKLGWERANWFATDGAKPETIYSFEEQNWMPYAAAEHRAARQAVALFDQTSFAKFQLEGRDAEAVLQRLCANDVGGAPGKVVYTGMLNERGGYESDLTVTRLAADAYLIVTGAAQATRDADWIRRHIPHDARALLTDVTSSYAVLSVMGPHSRALLQRVTGADLSSSAFPFGTMQEIGVGHALVRALRVSYVGELGWELYVPVECAAGVYDALVGAGSDLGVRDAGYYALESLRVEKGYRAWGRDITPDDTPLEAGLDFAVKLDKAGGFIGREALVAQKARGVNRRLVIFTLDGDKGLLWGDEPILRDGAPVGWVASAAFGHALGCVVAMGYVRHAEGLDRAFIESGRYEIERAGERIAARAHLRAPYDPEGRQLRQ
jgi:glycine cleavage system aminomethyltransferase T/glycine/D-amino acid oxidase-like deaminating enzyme